MITIPQLLQQLNIPSAYGYHSTNVEPPYLVYLGAGQQQFNADNTYYTKRNEYQIEYYFKKKNSAYEETIESLLLSNGYPYEKSEDIYVESEDVFVIYYTV